MNIIAMLDERNTSYRNNVHTPLHPNCNLCHYSGYSNLCTFSMGGECPYISMKKTIYRESIETKKKLGSSSQNTGWN